MYSEHIFSLAVPIPVQTVGLCWVASKAIVLLGNEDLQLALLSFV